MPIDISKLVVKASNPTQQKLLRKAVAIALERSGELVAGHPLLGRFDLDVGELALDVDTPADATVEQLASVLTRRLLETILGPGGASRVGGAIAVPWGSEAVAGLAEADVRQLEERILAALDNNGDLLAFLEVRLRTLLQWFHEPAAEEAFAADKLRAIRRSLHGARTSFSISAQLLEQRGVRWRRIPDLPDDHPVDLVCRECSAVVTLIEERWSRRGKALQRSGRKLKQFVQRALTAIAEAEPAREPRGELKPLASPAVREHLFHHGCSLEFAESLVFDNVKLEARGRGEFGLGFYCYENNPRGAAGTGKLFSGQRGHEEWAVVQFKVADEIFNKYIQRKLTFLTPEEDVQEVFDDDANLTRQMTWKQFVDFNRSRKEKHKKGKKSWGYQYIKGPLMPFRDDPGIRQIRFHHEGIDMLNDPEVERTIVDRGRT